MNPKQIVRTAGILIVILTCFLSSMAQRKQINVSQIDPRFTFSAERKWAVGDEEYFFYVQNNTSEEYQMVVNVTLELACVGTKSFVLGYNKVVYLKPNDRFDAHDDDYSHIYTSGASYFKTCRLTDGNSFTLFKGIRYTYSSIENITQKKAAEEKRKQEAEALKQKKIEEEKKAAEEKKKKEEELKMANEKKAAEEKKITEEKLKAEEKKKEEEKKETTADNQKTGTTATEKNSTTARNEYNAQREAQMQAQQREEEERRKEQEARDQRQQQYNEWKRNANEERRQAEAAGLAASFGVLTIVGGWIYNDKMGEANPDYVYDKPENKGKVRLHASIEYGYSFSYYPLIFASDKTTMINGNYQTTKSLEKRNATTINLDVNLKVGFEHDLFGGYGFLSPKAGFSPIFDGYQLSALVYGGRLFAGLKNIKVYGEYTGGNRGFTKTDNDPEESGKGKTDMKYQKLEYGLRITTNKDATFRRNHISLGTIMERLTPGGVESYSDPVTTNLISSGSTPWITGYAFQWKRDHTFNFYVNYYPAFIYGGETSFNAGSPSSEFKTTKTGTFFEVGFIRSIDFW